MENELLRQQVQLLELRPPVILTFLLLKRSADAVDEGGASASRIFSFFVFVEFLTFILHLDTFILHLFLATFSLQLATFVLH